MGKHFQKIYDYDTDSSLCSLTIKNFSLNNDNFHYFYALQCHDLVRHMSSTHSLNLSTFQTRLTLNTL